MGALMKRLKAEDFAFVLSSGQYRKITLEGSYLSQLRDYIEQTKRLEQMGSDEIRTIRAVLKGKKGKRRWLRFRTWIYMDNIGLDIKDEREMAISSLTNMRDYPEMIAESQFYDTFLSNLFADLTDLIDYICKNEAAYNRYVEKNLPKQYRYGRISRKSLVEIIPEYKLSIAEHDVARQALNALIENKTPTLKQMTIREYCKWYRIAYNAYNGRVETEEEKKKYDDTEFFDSHSSCCPRAIQSGGYDIDSEEDFLRFGRMQHYGEIGFSRCNIFGNWYGPQQWKIAIQSSYTNSTKVVLNMIAALYKAGAPLYLSNPAYYLAALDGIDYYAVKPDVFHDYRNTNDEDCSGSLSIPFPDEIYDDLPPEETLWTKERLQAVIAATKWEPLQKVKKNPNA